mgnify:CR=1 FL=1
MGIGECLVAIVTIICLTFIILCWIYRDYNKGDDKDALEKRSSKKMGK